MKARDVVPGWPKGRSTSLPLQEWAWPTWTLPYFRYKSDADTRQWRSDRYAEADYHAKQQAMVTAYFEQWRIGQVVRRDEIQEYFESVVTRVIRFPLSY